MKTFYTLLLFLGSCFQLFAQNFSVATTDTTFYGSATQSDFYGDIDLTNNTNNPLFMRWVRTEENMPAGWESSVCTPATCYPKTTDSADYTMPVNNSNNYINVHFYPNNQEGTGYIKIKVFETNNPDESAVMTFYGSTYPVGLQQQTTPIIQVYPNPVSSRLFIAGIAKHQNVFATVYNIIGREVMQVNLNSNSNTINVEDLPTGNYLIRVQGRNFQFSKKIVKT